MSTAQIAASDLVDQVLPGGAAVDLSAGALVELVSGPEVALSGARYRAYVLAVLVAMGTWIKAWRRAAITNPALAASARDEAQIEQDLAEFCSAEARLLDDPDDETRSLMSVLVGSVGDAKSAAEALIVRCERENSPVVRGFIVQGLLRVLGRMPEGEARALGLELTRILVDAPWEVLARANHELFGGWRTAAEKERLLGWVEIPVSRADPVRWPSEGV